jgi:hypothetical protein
VHLGLDVFMPEAGQPVKSVLECEPVKCAVVVNSSSSRPVKIHIYIYIYMSGIVVFSSVFLYWVENCVVL